MTTPALNLLGGYKIPVIGLGTAGKLDGDRLAKALDVALECGYRHIDTAYVYGSEETIGKVLNDWISSGKIKREELFIVTKLPSFGNTPEKVEQYLRESLKRLQLDYVDLYLIHHPIYSIPKDPAVRLGESVTQPTDHIALWKKMEEQVDAGLTRTIGLSNFNIAQIARILKSARIKPASLQVEIHIYLQNEELVKFAQDNGIVVVAYSPFGAPGRNVYSEESGLKPMIENATVLKLAAKHGKTPAQVLLKFLIQRGIVVIPKSYTPMRIKENFNLFDLTLDVDDLKDLRSLEVGEQARVQNFIGNYSHPEWPFKSKGTYFTKKVQLGPSR